MARTPRRIVVIGAGLAGAHVSLRLRDLGYGGELILVGEEEHAPYDRPPLSKAVLTGELEHTVLPHEWGELGVSLASGRRALWLDPAQRTVGLSSGVELTYEGLVLATGGAPVRLPGPGEQLTLRTLDDAWALRDRLRPGAHIAIVGASWIGAEVATAALAAGCRVTCVDAGPEPLGQALGAEVGALTRPWWDGADLRTGTGVRSVEDGGLILADGAELAADAVVVGIGVRPATAWLEGSGIALDRGVLVDPWLRSSAPGVVALGDTAVVESRRYGRRLRTEHWDDAVRAAGVAAATLLRGGAEPDPTDPVHDPVPYFWSNQFGHLLQFAGSHMPGDERVVRSATGVRGFSVGWFAEGRLTALLAVDRPRDLAQARKIVDADRDIDLVRFADAAVPLVDCVVTSADLTRPAPTG